MLQGMDQCARVGNLFEGLDDEVRAVKDVRVAHANAAHAPIVRRLYARFCIFKYKALLWGQAQATRPLQKNVRIGFGGSDNGPVYNLVKGA